MRVAEGVTWIADNNDIIRVTDVIQGRSRLNYTGEVKHADLDPQRGSVEWEVCDQRPDGSVLMGSVMHTRVMPW